MSVARTFPFFERLVSRIIGSAEITTNRIECAVFGAFFATLLLSFYGQLGSPLLYAVMFCICTWLFLLVTDYRSPPLPTEPGEKKSHYYVIGIFILTLLFLSCFMSPVTADAQRLKLARIILGVHEGSAWSTGKVDALSLMYYFPAPFYLIFTPLEALHLPRIAYSVVNAILMVGALLNLSLLFRKSSVPMLFLLVLFVAAPQFVFSGLEESEEALTFFLAARAAVWLIARPIGKQSLLFGIFCAVLAVAVKYSTAFFLVMALLALSLYCNDKKRWREWLQPKTMLTALFLLVLTTLVVMIPDVMTAADRGMFIVDNLVRLSQYHSASGAVCGIPHFLLRLFELSFDGIRIFINAFRIDMSAVIPAYNLLPPHCAFDESSLARYFQPMALGRDSTQYGFLPLVALAGIFLARGKERRIALSSVLFFLIATAWYTHSTMFWASTGRYFMVGLLILLPAFLIAMNALQQRHKKSYRIAVWLLLLPAVLIGVRALDNIPRAFTQGDRFTYRINGILPALHSVTGKANIYYNDLMSFYTLLRAIPSTDVSLKKEIMPNATNIIAVPREYSDNTNWHDTKWMLPIPSPRGEYAYMGPVLKNFGNVVPTAFYMGMPGKPSAAPDAVEIHFYGKEEAPETWVRALGNDYALQKFAFAGKTRYFIHTNVKNGLCLQRTAHAVTWNIETIESCQKSE